MRGRRESEFPTIVRSYQPQARIISMIASGTFTLATSLLQWISRKNFIIHYCYSFPERPSDHWLWGNCLCPVRVTVERRNAWTVASLFPRVPRGLVLSDDISHYLFVCSASFIPYALSGSRRNLTGARETARVLGVLSIGGRDISRRKQRRPIPRKFLSWQGGSEARLVRVAVMMSAGTTMMANRRHASESGAERILPPLPLFLKARGGCGWKVRRGGRQRAALARGIVDLIASLAGDREARQKFKRRARRAAEKK